MLLKSSVNGLMYKIADVGNLTVESWLAKLLSNDPDPNHFDSDYHLRVKDNRYANHEITKSHELARRIALEVRHRDI